MAITTRSMASMRRRSSRKPVPKLRDGFVQFMVGAHLARKQAPLRKRKAVKGCRLRCCDPNAVLCPSSPLPEEREYGITDLVPDPDESVAPFDYEQAVRDHYPCDKCHQKGPDSILMRHNPRNKMGSMDDILCEECLVSCISIIMDEGRDSEYRKKYMSQWIRVPVPKPETSRPLVPLEQGGQYRCRECKTMPNKVAFRVLHKEGDTEPGIYCEPCVNRQVVAIMRKGNHQDFGPMVASCEDVLRRFKLDEDLARICSSLAPSYNFPYYDQWPPARCESCKREFEHHAMSAYMMYIPQEGTMGVACHFCARNVHRKALIKFDGYSFDNRFKAWYQDGENNKLSGHVAPLTDITTLLGVHAIGAPVPVDYD
eukprot:jgi/Mesvir1/18155/Mv09453-RA.1